MICLHDIPSKLNWIGLVFSPFILALVLGDNFVNVELLFPLEKLDCAIVGIGGAGYDFGEGDLRKLLIFIGRVEKFFSWWGTDRKDCVREILLFR